MGELTNSFEPKGITRPPWQQNNETLTNRESDTVQRFVRLVEKKSCSLISRQEDIGPDPIVNQTDIYLHEMFERGTFCATNRVGLLRQPTKERNEKDRGGVEWRKEDTKERRWNYLHLCPGCRRGRRVYKSGTIGFGAIDFVIYDIQASEKD